MATATLSRRETRNEEAQQARRAYVQTNNTMLWMIRHGFDTLEIATFMRLSEQEVYNRISTAREKEHESWAK